MKAMKREKRKTIQSIALARRKNAANGGSRVGIRTLRIAKKKSPIEALKGGEENQPVKAQARDLREGKQEGAIKANKESNRLLAKVKRKKKRSCASCWGN